MIRSLLLAFVLLFLATVYRATSNTPALNAGITALRFLKADHLITFQDESSVHCEREVSAGDKKGSVRIRITIYKANTSGFARYSDVLPRNMRVESVITDGASFSIADGKVRFIWVSAPAKEILRIEYTLVGKSATAVKLKGEYSYLDENRTKKAELKEEMVDPQSLTRDGDVPVTAHPLPGKKGKSPETKKSVTKSTGSSVEYRVQVGAFRNRRVTAARLRKRFRLDENLQREVQDGYVKYMTGPHADYEEAREHKNKMVEAHGIRSAFVVAYRGGRRITIAEARSRETGKELK